MVNGFISTLVAFLIGGATLSFNFSAVDSAGNEIYSSDGIIVTFGGNYRMETDDILVVSDGKTKGIYQKHIDEMVLQPVDESAQAGIMDNPFALLQNPGGAYTVTPSDADSNGIPRKIALKAKNGEVYTILVKGYSKTAAPESSVFTIDPGQYPSAVVTDLR